MKTGTGVRTEFQSRAASPSTCFHCAESVPPGLNLYVEVDGDQRPMCCPGCQAVADIILGGGLGDYYRLREVPAAKATELTPQASREIHAYDLAEVQRRFVCYAGPDALETSLILEGIECAACAWLNERRLKSLPGVLSAEVNFSTHRARVRWDPSRLRLGEILAAVDEIGYTARPYDPTRREALLEGERKIQLRRLGIAGLLGMQVMMISVALYAGDWSGMDLAITRLLQWVGLALTTPVVCYSARPFFAGAWRDLRSYRVGMNVPVALGIGIASAGSGLSTLKGAGEVYYDSVVMFVFFLLLARYLQFVARRRSAYLVEALADPAPAVATRIDSADSRPETVPAAVLCRDDRVLIRPGDAVPADGVVLHGRSSVDESFLSGESRPATKAAGDRILAGSMNMESPLEMRVSAPVSESVLSGILALAERACDQKPRIAQVADRIAARFVGVVLALAFGIAIYWWFHDPQSWLPVTISVLVITCPCALSLATPTAITAAVGGLMRRGLVVTDSQAVETLARATRFVFDKTGTLTYGRCRVAESRAMGDLDEQACLRIAASLESHSEHPIAKAFLEAHAGELPPPAADPSNTPGAGLSGIVGGRRYFLGSPAFVQTQTGVSPPTPLLASGDREEQTVVLLADEKVVHCGFRLADELRAEAATLISHLRALGKRVSLYSGDAAGVVENVARSLGIEDAEGGLTPRAKYERVRALQRDGEVVAMVGDGLNDAPVLSGADVSISMGLGAKATQAKADVILLSNRLADLDAGIQVARRTRAIIVQNLTWAALYNLLALPAAAVGWVAPWMAAIGMSVSSVVVVGNSLRLGRRARND